MCSRIVSLTGKEPCVPRSKRLKEGSEVGLLHAPPLYQILSASRAGSSSSRKPSLIAPESLHPAGASGLEQLVSLAALVHMPSFLALSLSACGVRSLIVGGEWRDVMLDYSVSTWVSKIW